MKLRSLEITSRPSRRTVPSRTAAKEEGRVPLPLGRCGIALPRPKAPTASQKARHRGFWSLVLLLAVVPCRAAVTVQAWGLNNVSQTQVPAGLTNVIAVAAGYDHSLALNGDGTVTGWGYDFYGAATPPPGLNNVVAISAGNNYSLALNNAGAVLVWGNQSPPPAGLNNVTAIAAGWSHSVALKSDGSVVCWGSVSNVSNVPPTATNVTAIAAGNGQSLALRADGTLVAWGDDSYGKAEVPAGLSNVVAIAAGSDHCLALRRNGTVVGWGGNYDGQAIVPAGLNNAVAITAGSVHSVALRADGTLLAWGDNTYNQTAVNPNQPGFFSIAGGGFHNLALQGDGTPMILVQPASQRALITKSATFQVLAVGAAPLSYQWQKNGFNRPGATNSSLTLNNIQPGDAGPYAVVISNSVSVVTSAPAILTSYGIPPIIASQPQDTSTICGDSASFSAFANDGTPPWQYRWQFEGATIAGVTSTTLALNDVNTNQAGGYALVAYNPYGATTSSVAHLTVTIVPPYITSPLVAVAKQGQPFTYVITGLHSPFQFGASGLPPGLTVASASGLISGSPLESGTFGPIISAANFCSVDNETLLINIASSVPVINSPLYVADAQEAAFTYTITATESPTGFGAQNLPAGLVVNPTNGIISGRAIYAGDFYPVISASNRWGTGSATLHLSFSNAPVTGLSIADITANYSSPYLLDFLFTLRDDNDPTVGNALVVPPSQLSIVCKEDGQAISPTETALISETGNAKLLKAYLVLDFTESIASLDNGDYNGDGISDAVDNIVSGAQGFVNQQAADAQVGVYEFHREDYDPQQVAALTTDKTLLDQSIAGIWTNYVQWFPAGSRCWDALVAAIGALGPTNRDEQHCVICVSDGKDESSLHTANDVITAATNNGVKVYCVGFGDELDAPTLQNIASQTQGRYYTATNAADIATELAEVGKDFKGQYLLRWATLKRSTNSFQPTFEITYQGFTAVSPINTIIMSTNIIPPATNPPPPVTNIIIAPYVPTQHTGSVTVGSLRFVANADFLPKSVTLRASYVPRYIRQLRLHYRPNWPCIATIQNTNVGEILYGWSLTETNDGAGGRWLLLSSPYPQSLTNSIPFAALGNLVQFSLRDMVTASNAFSFFTNDNTLYTNTGGQSFVFENSSSFVTNYPVLPYGTPIPWLQAHGFTNNYAAAELSDPDGDGFVTWREYQANTDPRDSSSKLVLRTITQAPDSRWQITFSTALNRTYRVDYSFDLLGWQTASTGIPGTGTDTTITDTIYHGGTRQLFYRVLVY